MRAILITMTVSLEVRKIIIRMNEKGKSNIEIANDLGLNKSTIANILKMYKETGDIKPKNKPGRNPKVV